MSREELLNKFAHKNHVHVMESVDKRTISIIFETLFEGDEDFIIEIVTAPDDTYTIGKIENYTIDYFVILCRTIKLVKRLNNGQT